MFAVSRPSAASFIWRASAWMRVRSSRKMTAPALRRRPTGTKRAPIARVSVMSLAFRGRCSSSRHASKRRASAGAYSRERHVAAAPQRPEDALGARVELADDALPVDDEHAVLHVLDHVLAHLRHVLEIDLALRRELLARHARTSRACARATRP